MGRDIDKVCRVDVKIWLRRYKFNFIRMNFIGWNFFFLSLIDLEWILIKSIYFINLF